MSSIRTSQDPDEASPLLRRGERDVGASSSSSNGSTFVDDSPSVAATDLPDTATPAPPFGPLFASLAFDSFPVILSYVLQNSIQTVSVLVAGRLGPDELSAAAFALMLAMVAGWCVALGGTTALDTLGSQAFTGGDRAAVSVHFQRCLILLWLLFVPVAFLWTFIEPVLLALGQEERLSYDVQRFLRVLIVGAPGYIGFESVKKYLQCQGIMRASTYVLLMVAPVNLALNIFFIHYTPLGLLGSPAAISVTYWLCFSLLCLYTYLSPAHRRNQTWIGIRLATVFDIRSCADFLKLAIPGIFMVGTEWQVDRCITIRRDLWSD
ncbi:hypothetical protein EVJ58_g4136 [Rhodofomes roseus]|uniref:Multidrug resistance protein NorM n=1 Tax=Rhodofomes roseus TaxID=34475 RepID=A0A4Y9YI26_9APHY|nr:hypothetical protein EVJ58_g4136 [Rhodofomes roseus]